MVGNPAGKNQLDLPTERSIVREYAYILQFILLPVTDVVNYSGTKFRCAER